MLENRNILMPTKRRGTMNFPRGPQGREHHCEDSPAHLLQTQTDPSATHKRASPEDFGAYVIHMEERGPSVTLTPHHSCGVKSHDQHPQLHPKRQPAQQNSGSLSVSISTLLTVLWMHFAVAYKCFFKAMYNALQLLKQQVTGMENHSRI